MGNIPDHIIDEIRSRADIVEVVSEYLPLKKAGANYRCLCPFHDEKSPSFNVNPQKQIFHCFGCGEGGNVYTFLIKYINTSFPEAVRLLAQRYGVAIPESADNKQDSEIEELYSALAKAADYYHNILKKQETSSPVKRYMEKRKLDEKLVETFKIGWAPDSWESLTRYMVDKGFSTNILEKAGLSSVSSKGNHIDRFRARLMFPINNSSGKTLGFGGRTIDARQGAAKYINSPETRIYNKSKILFGFDKAQGLARKEGVMIVVEGYMDVIALHKAGVSNCVSASGTAFTGAQAELIKRACKVATLLFDSDVAGVAAAKRSGAIALEHGLAVRSLILPDAKDPDEFLLNHGADEFKELVAKAPSFIEFIIDIVVNNKDLSSIEDRVAAVNEVAPYLKQIKDKVEKYHYIQLLAERTKTDVNLLSQKVNQGEARPEFKRRDITPKPAKESWKIKTEKMLIRILLDHPEYINNIGDQLGPDDFSDPLYKEMFELINRGVDKGAKSPSDMLGLTEDEQLRRSVSALICEPGLMVEEEPEKAANDCVKSLKKKPEVRNKWKEEMKLAAKKSQDKEAQTDFIKAQEKYFETREK